ncbi:hypothetical protein, partial [Oceanobacillus aidingensis]
LDNSRLSERGKGVYFFASVPSGDGTEDTTTFSIEPFFSYHVPALLQKAGASRMMINLPQLINFVH